LPFLEKIMKRLVRRLLETVTVLGALCLPGAHAGSVTVNIDFDDPALVGLYFAGDSFNQSGMRMTAGFDFGTVDSAAALGNAAPAGNATSFYFNANDGALFVEQEQGLTFDLTGFSAAFVPLIPASTQPTVMAAIGFDAGGSAVAAVAWLFAPQDGNGRYQFARYDDPLDFTDFVNLSSLALFSCSLSGPCTDPTNNNGQFAVDDIQVSLVPEPSSVALTLFALGLLVRSQRRRGR
jgi:hypothetical protein